MKTGFNVGLIGFGNAGKYYHAPYIDVVEGLHLMMIRETKHENITFIQTHYPSVSITFHSSEVLLNKDIDVVVIAVPNHLHYALAKEALLHNKHVVVDKPFTISSAQADELIALAKTKQLTLTVYHNRRFSSDFRTVKKLVNSGMLGKVVEYEAHFDRFRNEIRTHSWKETEVEGSGILYDMGSHLIDQAIQLFGLPDAVYADLRVQRKNAASVDSFEVILDYGNLKASLNGSMLVMQPRPQFAVYGDKGAFVKYGMDVQESHIKEGRLPKDNNNWGIEPTEFGGVLSFLKDDIIYSETLPSEKGNYADFYQNLYYHLSRKQELAVKAEEARDVVRVIELAIESNKAGQQLSIF